MSKDCHQAGTMERGQEAEMSTEKISQVLENSQTGDRLKIVYGQNGCISMHCTVPSYQPMRLRSGGPPPHIDLGDHCLELVVDKWYFRDGGKGRKIAQSVRQVVNANSSFRSSVCVSIGNGNANGRMQEDGAMRRSRRPAKSFATT